MRARVLLHIREHEDGPVVVTPVSFADLTFGADSYEEAVASLKPRLAARLTSLEPVDRLPHLDAPRAELFRMPIEVKGKDKAAEPIEVAVGIVVVTRSAKSRSVSIAYAPILPPFQLASRRGDGSALAERAAARVAGEIRGWSPDAVLAADEPADSRLEIIEIDVPAGGSESADEGDEAAAGILAELGVDLTRREAGRIDRREDLVRRALETLAAEGRSSVQLVGPADVGKTALVHEIARRVARGEVPARLRGKQVWRLSANELIAGALYTGQWQERTRRLIDEARRTEALIVMGDPVGIVDAGRWSQSDNNVSRYLRPFVESGEITIVCECTPEQFAAAQKKEPSFIDAFHRLDVAEPNAIETQQIATDAAGRLAVNAGIDITADAVTAAVELTHRFEPYRSFPGKAVRLLEDTVRERPEDATQIDRDSITDAFARRTGMPLALLSDAVPLRVDDVRAHFEARVLGQPEATETMVDIIMVLKAGLHDPQQPLASCFFVGPTGVGKTELAKALAEFLFGSRDRMIRLDMSEYSSDDAVQRLVGTSWGVEGELTRRVRQQPFCVVLLDEIEKAHWRVFDALLAALGEGRLTDASGRSADFRNAIVIMTSNLGATRAQTQALGFSPTDADSLAETRYVEAAEKFFRPEFFNRIDRIIVFHALTTETVRRIARRELKQLLEREGIVRRGLRVEVDHEVVERVATAGFHPRYGARPLQREIEQAVIRPLAHLLLEKSPGHGELIRVQLAADTITVKIQSVEEKPTSVRRRERKTIVDDAALTKAERAAKQFLGDLRQDDAAGFAAEVRPVISQLIEDTHQPSFWDDADRARMTLQRIYQLERVLDAFDDLEQRAVGLAEMAKRVREAHDRSRVKEVTTAIDEMLGRLLVLRLELAAAAAGAEGNNALVRIVSVSPDDDRWAKQLTAMYVAWAIRTGRDASVRNDGRDEISIEGLATSDLLAGEAGLHRHIRSDRSEALARVVVSPAGEDVLADDGAIVRVYEEGKRRIVRDPRTDARVSHVASVLTDGIIDPFLIAWLRQRPNGGG